MIVSLMLKTQAKVRHPFALLLVNTNRPFVSFLTINVSCNHKCLHKCQTCGRWGCKSRNHSQQSRPTGRPQAHVQGPTGVLGIGYHCCFFQVLMVSIWFILGIEYQTENDFWVLKYQFQFWYQKSQKILVSGIMKLWRKFPPIPLNFQNIVWCLYASFW